MPQKALEIQHQSNAIFAGSNAPIALRAVGLDAILIENIHTFVHFIIPNDK